MEKWFLKRGLTVLNYQKEAIDKVQESLIDSYETILAACPGAGKTIMSIYALDMFLSGNPSKKAMVLTHGTTILRSQYHDVLEKITPDFKFFLVEKYKDMDDCSVNVCLPQTIYRMELPKIDILVVDEAHQFYDASMVKEIIKKTRPERILLLTGSPSPFIAQKKEIIPVSLITVFDENRISDFYAEVVESKYNFGFQDYNKFDELLSNKHFNKNDTERTLDNLLEKIVYRVHSVNFEVEHKTSWNYILQSLRKTMFACRSQEQAKQVKHYFDNIGVNSALSISDEDEDSEEISRFVADSSISVLIVVYRGILGFDFTALINIIDMTMSQNVDRIFQLMCRVIRPYQDNNKFFFKIAPDGYGEYFTYLMNGVLAMSHEDFYTRYNGKNFKELEFPVMRKEEVLPISEKEAVEPRQKGSGLQMVELSGLPAFKLMKDIRSDNDTILKRIAYANMRDVKNELSEVNYRGYWTLERCKESALKYKTRSEWSRGELSAYLTSFNNGWHEECCAHMEDIKKPNGYWTLERCKESALKYNTIKEWNESEISAYSVARQNKWVDLCCAHMNRLQKPNGYWTLERCKESALKYKTKQHWKTHEISAYNASYINGWHEECCAHMEDIKKPDGYWTLERCKESALRFKTRTEWKKGESSAYTAAVRNNWVNLCCAHMEELQKRNGYWTLERCKESALKYKTKKEWEKGEISAHSAAYKHKWINLCCAHMKSSKSQ